MSLTFANSFTSTYSIAVELHVFLWIYKSEFFNLYYVSGTTISGYWDVIESIITEAEASSCGKGIKVEKPAPNSLKNQSEEDEVAFNLSFFR